MKVLHLAFLLAVAAGMAVPASIGVPMMHTELERGIALASVAATTQSVLYSHAQEVYGQVQILLPNIRGLSGPQHAALTARVTDLRMALEIVPGAMYHERDVSD